MPRRVDRLFQGGAHWRGVCDPDRSPASLRCDDSVGALSNMHMNERLPRDKISFTLSSSAEAHLQKILPDWIDGMSKRELVSILSYSGGGRREKGGKVIWEYRGPLFLLAGQKRESLRDGKYYDVLGFPVWIGEIENLLLKGRVLTFIKVGSPEPEEYLVIENAPENYFELALKDACRVSCSEPKVKQGL